MMSENFVILVENVSGSVCTYLSRLRIPVKTLAWSKDFSPRASHEWAVRFSNGPIGRTIQRFVLRKLVDDKHRL